MPKFVIFGDPMEGFIASAKAYGAFINDFKLNPVYRQITRIHLSKSINAAVPLPFKRIWSKISMRGINISDDDDVYFIFCEAVKLTYFEDCLMYFRKKYSRAKLIHYFQNPAIDLTGVLAAWKRVKHLYDASITFNKADADKYGILYTDYRPCLLPEKKYQPESSSDIFFVGVAKDRLPKILSVYERLTGAGLKCDFWVTQVPKSEQKYPDMIHYNSPIPYDDVCQKVKNTKCVLEILPYSQNYSSLRPCEALCYHKKLLTTNLNAPSEWFYNPEFVQVFSDASEIDTDFIRKPLSPQDERRIFDGLDPGDFSPFADFIIKNVHRRDS